MAHSHAHLFDLWLLCTTTPGAASCGRDHAAGKATNIYPLPKRCPPTPHVVDYLKTDKVQKMLGRVSDQEYSKTSNCVAVVVTADNIRIGTGIGIPLRAESAPEFRQAAFQRGSRNPSAGAGAEARLAGRRASPPWVGRKCSPSTPSAASRGEVSLRRWQRNSLLPSGARALLGWGQAETAAIMHCPERV